MSHSIMFSGSNHAVAKGKIFLFLWLCSIPLCKYISFFIYSPTGRYLDCFQILAVVNNTAVNTRVPIWFQIGVWGLLGYSPRSGIAGSKAVSFLFF